MKRPAFTAPGVFVCGTIHNARPVSLSMHGPRIRRQKSAMHKFSVGQSVHFEPSLGNRLGARGTYKVVRQMPVEADQYRYRIKGTHENFERTAEEHQLTRGG